MTPQGTSRPGRPVVAIVGVAVGVAVSPTNGVDVVLTLSAMAAGNSPVGPGVPISIATAATMMLPVTAKQPGHTRSARRMIVWRVTRPSCDRRCLGAVADRVDGAREQSLAPPLRSIITQQRGCPERKWRIAWMSRHNIVCGTIHVGNGLMVGTVD